MCSCVCRSVSTGCPSVKLILYLLSFAGPFTFHLFFHYLCSLLLFYFSPSQWEIAVLIRCQGRVLVDTAWGRRGKTGQSRMVRVPQCAVRHPARSNRAQFVAKYWIFYYFLCKPGHNCISIHMSLTYIQQRWLLFFNFFQEWFMTRSFLINCFVCKLSENSEIVTIFRHYIEKNSTCASGNISKSCSVWVIPNQKISNWQTQTSKCSAKRGKTKTIKMSVYRLISNSSGHCVWMSGLSFCTWTWSYVAL